MRAKIITDINLVNRMIRNGWTLSYVKNIGTEIEFLMIKDEELSQQELEPPAKTVTN